MFIERINNLQGTSDLHFISSISRSIKIVKSESTADNFDSVNSEIEIINAINAI